MLEELPFEILNYDFDDYRNMGPVVVVKLYGLSMLINYFCHSFGVWGAMQNDGSGLVKLGHIKPQSHNHPK